MSNVEAPYSESKKTASAYSGMMDLPIVFSIPIYLSMPEEAVQEPEKQYNPNNWLKSLKIYDIDGKEQILTPTFNTKLDMQEYYLFMTTPLVQVEAEAVSSKADVLGTGFHVLDTETAYTVTITVIAENGDEKEYKILVFYTP